MSAQVGEQLTLFQAGFPASPFPVPGSAEAQRMTVTSGQRCAELLRSSGPLGLLGRMLLGSSVWRSTRCLLTWKVSATPHKRLLFRLVPQTPRTGGTDAPLWPTMTASEAEHGGPNGIYGTGSLRLTSAVEMWQTPNVPNGGRVNPPEMSPTGIMPDGTKRQVGLEHQVKMVERGLWPTPQSVDYKGVNHNPNTTGQSGHNLPKMVSLFPTQTTAVGGQLNPTWVETLMGFPENWTKLED